MNLYSERLSPVEAYRYASPNERVKILNDVIYNLRVQIRLTREEIESLGLGWFGEKRQRKRQLKAELKVLLDRLSTLESLRRAEKRGTL